MIRAARIAGLAALGLVTAAAAPTPSQADDEAAIVAGEQAWGEAFVTGNVAAVDALLDKDFLGTGTDGSRYDKATMLDWVRKGPNITSDVVGPVKVRFFGDVAVAQGSERVVGAPPERTVSGRIWTDVWMKRDGKWRIIAAQDMKVDVK